MTAFDRIVTIINRKGGAGKSTTTLNLAGALREAGRRVLVVDLDPQASLTRLLSDEPVESGQGIGACIRTPGLDATALIRPTAAGIDLLPGDRTIESVALGSYDNPGAFKRLRRTLAAIPGYDAILLDTPPALGFAVTSAMLAAGWAVLPTALAQQDLDALLDTLSALQELEADGETCCRRLAIVPNAYRGGTSIDRHGVQLLRDTFGDEVADPVPLAEAIRRALSERRPVTASEPRTAAAEAYRALARRVVAVIGDPLPAGVEEVCRVGA
ncbi:MAG TPA: ParA family protein [Thermomicrobiales bacterium]|nr:ParA family protein [Thermomicrobiales bacterium]